ncbi:MAG TPA: RHS repeat-associated core domain-containing protein [Terriglobales bacterium]|nr:RHS repeat-associated core domain-containing protein [Terriglobales bacterium]
MSSVSVSSAEVTEIDLPNGEKYVFAYDPTFGRVSRITFPTGGYVRYVWGLNASSTESHFTYAVGSNSYDCYMRYGMPAVTDRYVSFNGITEVLHQHFTYSTTWGSDPGGWTSKQTTVTTADLVTNQQTVTSYNYTGMTPDGSPYDIVIPNTIPAETSVVYQDGSGHIIETVNKIWKNSYALAGEQTILDNGQGTTKLYCYDSNEQITDVYEYGFQSDGVKPADPSCVSSSGLNTSAIGPLLRHTTTAYHNFLGGTPSTHIVNEPDSITSYDGSGNQVRQTAFAYTESVIPSGVETGHVSPPGLRGNVSTITRWLNTGGASPVTSYAYYDTGQIASMTDPCGNTACADMVGTNHTTSYSYTDNFDSPPASNTDAYLTQVTDALGHVQRFKYAYSDGQLIQSQDQNDINAGRAGTTYSYNDPLRRLTETDYPDGGRTTFSYNDVPPSPTITTSRLQNTNGQWITNVSVLDGMGHATQSQLASDPQGNDFTDTTYDGLGRTSTKTNPHRSTSLSTDGTTTFLYDALGRTLSVTEQDGSISSTSYAGNCATVTDEAGKSRKSCSDALGRLTQVFEDPAGLNYETDYTYDALDNLTRVVQAGSRQRTFVYDSLSRLISATNPESGTISYSYDVNGNLASKTAPAPNQTGSATVTTTYTYDPLNRVTQKTYSDGTPTATLSYDEYTHGVWSMTNPVGRLTVAFAPSYANHVDASEVFSYDPMGRVILHAQAGALAWGYNTTAAAYNVNFTYDLAGDLTSVNHISQFMPSSGVQYAYSYDAASRPISLTSNFVDSQHPATLATVDASMGYYPSGGLRKMTFGNALTQTSAYNNRLQPCRINVNASSTVLGACSDPVPSGNMQDFNYSFNLGLSDNGNMTNMNATGVQNFSRAYGYDSLNRLTTLSSPSDPSGCTGLSWGYDAWGNRTDQSVTGGTCNTFHASITATNQLYDPVNNKYQYDAAGNMTYDGSHTYFYDAENRLIQVDGTFGQCSTATACYIYGVDGRRVTKLTGGIPRDYVYDLADNTIAELTPSGWQVGYAYLGSSLIAQYSNNTTYFVHVDHLGSTRLLTAAGTSTRIQSSGGTHPWKYYYTGVCPSVSGTTYTVSVWIKNQGTTSVKVSGNIVEGPVIPPGATQQVSISEVGDGTSCVQLGLETVNTSDSFDLLAFAPAIMASGTNLIPPANQDFSGWNTYQGSSVTLTQGEPALIVDSMDYLPFGEQIAGSSASSHKFTGKERDSESALDNFGARYFSSAMGRFTSPDPDNAGAINEDPQSWNAYAYARNNPLRYTDPDGLDYKVCVDNGNGGQNCTTYANFDAFQKAAKDSGATVTGDDKSGQISVNGQNIGSYQFFVGPGVEGPGVPEDNILAPILFGGIFGGLKAGVRGIAEGLFGGGAKAAAETTVGTAAEQVIASGTKSAVKQALEDAAISDGQKAAVKSALDRAASTAKVKLEQLADGSLRITTERAGRNGFQAIEKVVDASGTTKSVVQKAFDSAGNLVHVDPKFP